MKVLVATSVGDCGPDIQQAHHIINYDMPRTFTEYLLRIGSTNHKITSFYDKAIDFELVAMQHN